MVKFLRENADTGDSFFSHVFPDDISLAKDFFGMISDQNPEISFECRMIMNNGDAQWFSWRVRVYANVYPIRYLVLGHVITDDDRNDSTMEYYKNNINELVQTQNIHLRNIHQKIMDEITQRRKIEDTLSNLIFDIENEVTILKEVIKNTPEILFVFDLDGNLQYLNSQAAQLLGSTIHSLIGKKKNELGLSSEIQDVISGKHFSIPTLTAPLNGFVKTEYDTYDYRIIPLRNHNGFTTAILLILFNRTSVKYGNYETNGSSLHDPSPVRHNLFFPVMSFLNTIRQNFASTKR